MPRRIVIETSAQQKESLDLFLQDSGTTLSDWFSTKVAEAIAPYTSFSDSDSGLVDLSALEGPMKVLASLSRVDWSFTESDTSYLSHGLHPYPAKFIPQIPRTLISKLSTPGELVWDPFGGSGTTALEALLAGRRAVSSDVNPVANVIGQAKTISLTTDDERAILKFAGNLELLGRSPAGITDAIDRQRELDSFIPPIPNIEKWFHPNAVRELAYLRLQIAGATNIQVKKLALSTFSKIILRASFQDNETRYSSKPRDVAVGEIVRLFAAELTSALAKVRGTSTALRLRAARFITADIRNEVVVDDASVDLVVTSPPYPNATDYHLYHRFRIYWLGFLPQEVGKREIGSHLRHQKEKTGIDEYVEEMSLSLVRIRRALRPGRYAVLVLGDGVFDRKAHNTAKLLSQVAHAAGLQTIGTINRPVHATKRSFIPAARRLRHEQLLVFRRPPEEMTFELEPPPYRLWPYEHQLQSLEIKQLVHGLPQKLTVEGSALRGSTLIADRLRRLTFFHAFRASGYHRERTWQAILENGDAQTNSKRKDPKYATHGLHAYKGKFYPQLAKSLFNIVGLEPGDLVVDPFCGSGTVLLEARLNGLSAKGMDLNPLAVRISRAKVGILSSIPAIVDRILGETVETATRLRLRAPKLTFDTEILRELSAWFPTPVLSKIGALITVIDDVPEPAVRDLLTVCLSSIVRDVSQQDGRDLRIRRRKVPIEDAPVVELFVAKVAEQRARLRHFAERSAHCPTPPGTADVIEADSCCRSSFEALGLGKDSANAVVTSPPYATALPYIDTDRLSLLLLLGMRSRDRASVERQLTGSREITNPDRAELEQRISDADFGNIKSDFAIHVIREVFRLNKAATVGFRRRNQASLLYRYFRGITQVFGELDYSVRAGGSLVFVIGDNVTQAGGREVVISSGRVIEETGKYLGWNLQAVIPITVTKEARPHSRNSITKNEILWFKKS